MHEHIELLYSYFKYIHNILLYIVLLEIIIVLHIFELFGIV